MDPEIWIYGHWLSCNMGDRFQARGVAKYLSLFVDLSKLVFVNFSKDIKPMSVELDGVKYPVYGPEDVKDRSPRLIILVTGSIDYMAKFIPWIKNQLDKDSLDEVIIWGGFGHGRKGKAHRDGLDLFLHPKITFWSRSWRDADMFQEWFGRPSRLAGDPMAFWILNEPAKGWDKSSEYENIVIPSIYAWRFHPEVWEEVMKKADRVISIDNVADYKLKATIPRIEFINDPTKLIPILRKAKNVISGRLHGGLLSALINIPTAMVVTDDAAPGEGTYKFEAVARTGCGPDKALCASPSAKDLSLPLSLPSERFYPEEYLNLTAESLLIIKNKVKQLFEHHRIAIVAWYNTPLDQIKVAIEEFERQGHQAISVDAINVFDILGSFQPDVILIWNRHQGVEILPRLRKVFSGKILLFNWDDPHAVLRSDLLKQIKDHSIDHVFSTCRSTKKMYLDQGVGGWTYLPPFYSKNWHYPEVEEKYQHDVSLVCTNFYKDSFPGQLISRYELVKALDDDPAINFGLYGPESFRSEFPRSYCGPINYADNHKIFTSSKINLSTHVENGDGYTNERCITILASGGLLLVDPINGWQELFGQHGCVVMQSCQVKDVIAQIKEILSTYYPRYEDVRKEGLLNVKKYEVKEWVKTILSAC